MWKSSRLEDLSGSGTAGSVFVFPALLSVMPFHFPLWVVLTYFSTSSINLFLLLQIVFLYHFGSAWKTVAIVLFAYLGFNIETCTNLGNIGFKNWVNFPFLSEVFCASFYEQKGTLGRIKSKQGSWCERWPHHSLTMMVKWCPLCRTESQPDVMMPRCLTECLARVGAECMQAAHPAQPQCSYRAFWTWFVGLHFDKSPRDNWASGQTKHLSV